MIAAKHFDPVLGVDIHIIQPPGPVPPLPVPHPFVGMLVDPTEYVPIIGGTVKINGMMRGVAGTGGKAVPPHIPIGGVFVMPPGNECEMFMGSATVAVDGDPQSRLGDPALSCQSVGMPSIPRLKMHARPKTLMLPTSVVLAVPMGPPVMVGGPPTISIAGMAMKFGLAALGKALKKVRALQKSSKKWKAVSDKMNAAANKVLDKVPGGNKLKNKASNAICSLTGHPVDVASGKVTTDSTDVALPGPLPFQFSRVWYSQSDYQGPLGHGWHHSYDLGLYSFPEGIVLRLTDGRFVVFAPPVPGEPAFDRTEKLFLHLTEKGYHAETPDGLVYHFGWPNKGGSELPLDHVRDANDNRIVLERERGKLVAFVDSGGRRLPVTTDAAGRITEIRVPDPDKPGETYPMVTYRYDRRGDLVQADDALGNPLKYEYLDHLLVRETDRSGLAFYFMYDGSGADARCLRTWGDGDLFLRDLSYDDARQRTEVTDSLGHVTTYEWNDTGLVVKETDPLGGATLTEWGPHNDKLSVTDPNGATTAFAYDDLGRLVGVTHPTGATIGYEFDSAGRLKAVRDSGGHAWVREHDSRGNVIAVTDPLGHRWCYQVNDRGMPVSQTDPLGHTSTYQWDAAGRMAASATSTVSRTGYEYDTLGRLVRVVDATNGVTHYRRDRRGLATAVTDSGGRTTTARFDAAGQVIEQRSDDGAAEAFTYFSHGRLSSATSPSGKTVRYRYDTEGRLAEAVDAGENVWRFERDAAGRVIEETTFDGRVLRYEYDPCGRRIASTNARGQRVTLTRDTGGRVVARTLPDGSNETFAYTPAGRLVSAANAAAKLTWAFDPCGRVIREANNGRVVASEYNAVGRRVRRTSPFGRVAEFEYDPDGRLVGATADGERLFTSSFDEFGREQRRVGGGGALEWEYSGDGDLTAVHVKGERAVTRRYEYDRQGRRNGQSDDVFGRATFTHDLDGHLTAAETGTRPPAHFAHDRAGNLFPPPDVRLARDADGNVTRKGGRTGEWEYAYDPMGRLTEAKRAGGEAVAFAYDPFGRRVRKAAAGGTPVEYLWDGDTVLGQRADEEVEYLYRPGTFLPLVQFDRGGPLLLALDPVGLPVAALAHDGQTAWEAEIDPHAGVAAERGEPGRVALRYPGQMADAETGLVYNRMRYLDPETRQYVSPDPIGLSGGFHPFNYTVDPLAQIDPYGLNPCGTLPPGAKVVRDGSPKYIVYEVNGEKRIRFKADEAVTLKEANPGRNYTTDTYAGLDPAGQPYVHEGRHRAIGASQGATVPEELGGVPSAPGYLDYEFSNNVAPSGGKPVKDLSIDNSVPDLDKAAADQAHQNKIRRK